MCLGLRLPVIWQLLPACLGVRMTAQVCTLGRMADVAVVSLPAEAVFSNCAAIRNDIADALQGTRVVVADLTQTEFCDTSGMRELAAAYQRAASCGVALRIVLPPNIRRKFELTGLAQVLPVYESLNSAWPGSGALHHAVSFYRSDAEFRTAVVSFALEALAAGEPVLVAAPRPRLEPLRAELQASGDAVTFVDAADTGANPARLIPAYRQFADSHPGRRVRLTGELAWPERTTAEIAEIIRHEALVNLALAGAPMSIHCLYDARILDSAVRADIERAHPLLIQDGTEHDSETYPGPGLSPFCDQPLPTPPASAVPYRFKDGNDLPALRRHVSEHAARFGLADGRIRDLVMAVNELATNTLRHGPGPGELRIWPDGASAALTCQVTGPGHITDSLAGRHRPPELAAGGQGLWLVNQLCDLVELRTQPTETIIRVHVRPLPGSASSRARIHRS